MSKRGRPPRADGPSAPIAFRISQAERAAWQIAAGPMRLSDWARSELNRIAKLPLQR